MTAVIIDRRPAVIAGHGSWVPLGTLSGLAVGTVARAWMRWISTDPEFSWSGTLFIVGAFTLFGAVQAGAAAARDARRSRRRTTVYRTLAAILSMSLFVGAGALMLPTVLLEGLALWRRDWWRTPRLIAAFLGLAPVAFVVSEVIDDFGLSVSTIAKLAVFLTIYATVVAATMPTFAPLDDGWRLPAAARWFLVIAFAGAIAALIVVNVFFP